jgi:hypothetical protein
VLYDEKRQPLRYPGCMFAPEEAVEDLAELYVAERAARGQARALVHRVTERREHALSRGVSKALAARILEVSVPTLDKWIARDRIETVADPKGKRRLVDARSLAELLVRVRALRELGHRDGVLAEAIQTLERDDPQYQRQFDELFGASLESIGQGDLEPVVIPESFGPED